MAGVRETVMAAATYILRGGADATAIRTKKSAQDTITPRGRDGRADLLARTTPIERSKVEQLMVRTNDRRCLNCRHFRNSPEYLESVFKGLATLSSAWASVRKDDGVCLLKDLYLSADACCEAFEEAAAG
jgi:hypothetical protein